jgi:hypothetical protein
LERLFKIEALWLLFEYFTKFSEFLKKYESIRGKRIEIKPLRLSTINEAREIKVKANTIAKIIAKIVPPFVPGPLAGVCAIQKRITYNNIK